MDSIVIDPATGHIATTSMLQTPSTPGLHISSIGRAIKRTLKLESYKGPKTVRSTIGGKRVFTAPLETCEFIIDNINGGGWDEWRKNSGQEFKKALRERVQSVLDGTADNNEEQQVPSPSPPSPQQQGPPPPPSEQPQQVLQPQPEQPHGTPTPPSEQPQQEVLQPQPQPEQHDTDQHMEKFESKSVTLQKALRAMNIIGSVRIDEPTALASNIDVIKLMCPGKSEEYASKALARVIARDAGDQFESGEGGATSGNCDRNSVSLAERVRRIKINGKGRETPVSDAKTIVEIIWLLPAGAAREFRRQSAETITRVLGGDVSLCEEIEQRCARLQSTDEGRAYQQFMTGGSGESPTKRTRVGPPIMMHATEEQYKTYVDMEVTQQLTKAIHTQMNNEVAVVLSMKEAFEAIRPLNDLEKIELHDKMSDISYRTYRKVGGGQAPGAVGGELVVAPAQNAVAVATAVEGSHVDPGHDVATPQCHASVRGDEISIAMVSAEMGVRLGGLAGQVGKRMKALYTAQYGAFAGANLPKRPTRFNGKPFNENVYFARDRNLMEQAIREVAQP